MKHAKKAATRKATKKAKRAAPRKGGPTPGILACWPAARKERPPEKSTRRSPKPPSRTS